MPAITVREVPTETRDELASRAARNGQSLQEYLRTTLIELAAQPRMHDLLAEVRTRKHLTGTMLAADEILELRDSGRR